MNTIIALFIILLLSASVFFSMFFALWIVYLILKQQYKIVETCFSVSVFSIVSNEIIPNINSESENIIVHNLTFKKFLLYVLYCMNEDYYDNLYNYLYN